jgi:hypothetical protein
MKDSRPCSNPSRSQSASRSHAGHGACGTFLSPRSSIFPTSMQALMCRSRPTLGHTNGREECRLGCCARAAYRSRGRDGDQCCDMVADVFARTRERCEAQMVGRRGSRNPLCRIRGCGDCCSSYIECEEALMLILDMNVSLLCVHIGMSSN